MPKLKVDGREYDYPAIDSITFDEAEVILEVANIEMGELFTRILQGSAGALKALFCVAKLRADGGYDAEAIGKLAVNAVEFIPDLPVVEDESSPLDEAAEAEALKPVKPKPRKTTSEESTT